MNDLALIAEALSGTSELLLATHLVADGDCLGSMLAAFLAFRSDRTKVWAIHPEPVPYNYRFLKGWKEILPPGVLPSIPPVALVLDCTDLDRVGEELAVVLRQVPLLMNIDHHAGNHGFGHLNYVKAEASSTAELVLDLLEKTQRPLTPEISLALYTGVATDTGCFQYENTSSHTHLISARLLEAGVNPAEVHRCLWQEKPLEALRLLAKVLPTLTLSADGRVAWLWVTVEAMKEVGAGQEHCEGLVEYARSVAGVEVALFFRQVSPNEVKVGFRSKQYVDVNLLAARFGGGGHRRASGCTVKLPLDQAVSSVVEAAQSALPGAV